MRKKHGFTLIETLIGLTIIAVLAVGAYAVWRQPVDEGSTTTPTTTPVPSYKVAPTPTSTEKVIWSEYSDDKGGFTINYPQDWKYEQASSSVISGPNVDDVKVQTTFFSPAQVFSINPGVFRITIYEPANETTLEDFVTTYICTPIGEYGNRCSNIYGQTLSLPTQKVAAKKVEYNPVNQFAEAIIIKKGKNFYEFGLNFEKPTSKQESRELTPDERRQLFNQILSTFQFTD